MVESIKTYGIRNLIAPVLIALLAVLAPFFFPWPLAFAIGVFASFFIPAIGIVNGGLIDLLYYTSFPGAHAFPYFTILGIIAAIFGAFVQQFIKTRIMS
jgi:hypothetical protein